MDHLLLARPLDCRISQCPKVKRFFCLKVACSQTSSPPPAMSSTATPMIPWYPCCGFLSTKTHGSQTDVSNPSPLAAARKQFLHSLVPSAGPLTVLSNFTQTSRGSPGTSWSGILTKSGCSLSLDQVTSVKRLLHIVTGVHDCTRTARLS